MADTLVDFSLESFASPLFGGFAVIAASMWRAIPLQPTTSYRGRRAKENSNRITLLVDVAKRHLMKH